MKWTEEEINKILDKKHDDGTPIDVFNLYFVLCVGNAVKVRKYSRYLKRVAEIGEWDVERFAKWSQHNVPITLADFEDCSTSEEVIDTFAEIFDERLREQL